ncbi:beta-1,3-galactosyltransferase 2-like [Protopterus annectens]|uniref:beta-1,3-galactosyltransferase 2-like n=1 Tax=Protopterus annectens TaxID=7888 RepID=UPI001CFA08FB|nr:beta-1,3-galactosyltransferase 2-like [Protopterus annectens]
MLETRKCRRFLLGCALMSLSVFLLSFHSTRLTRVSRAQQYSIPSQIPQNNTVIKYPLDFVYPYNYSFILNEPDKCRHGDPFVVILILTQAHAIGNRHAIRQTWGNESLVPGVSLVRLFLLGMPKHFTNELQEMLEDESKLFHDIIQQNFMDTYINLTIKTMMGLQWVSTFCPNVSYIMKIDDDMFLNTEHLVKFLNPKVPGKKDYFTGYVVKGTRPVRAEWYRYYLPKELYEPDYFPPYCGGPGYLLSGDMAKKIYDIAHVIKPFHVEDAFMGVCLEKLKVAITVAPKSFFNGHKIAYEKCQYSKLITVHHFGPDELLKLWPDFTTAKELCQTNNTS